MSDDDLLVFADDEVRAPEPASAQVWKLLVVDDEPEIHDITRLAIGDLRIDGHPLAILSVYSATAARVVLQSHLDIAVILLDVVMESEHAGLELVRPACHVPGVPRHRSAPAALGLRCDEVRHRWAGVRKR